MCLRMTLTGIIGILSLASSDELVLSSPSEVGRNFAFLVACGEYAPGELKAVPFTLAEMNRFRAVLLDSAFTNKNIVYLHDKTDEPVRYLPTRANIMREFRLLTERLRPEDSVIVVMSGHGIQYRDDAHGFFCPVDAKIGRDHKGTLVPMEGRDGLLTLLENSRASKKLLVVNACRNDPLSQAFLASQKVELVDDYPEEAPKGTLAVFACSKAQRSFFYDDQHKKKERRNQSLFMYHLIETWKQAASTSNKMTMDQVLKRVRDRVEEDAIADFRENQIPLIKRNFQGEWMLTMVVPARPAAEDSLERGLLRQAPRLLEHFQKQGYENVGVLKFQAAHAEDRNFSNTLGPLNLLTARRLEIALILANDPGKPVGIIDNASEVARTIAGAGHRTKAERDKLFGAAYPLAWGKTNVKPDAFITGTIIISKDLHTLKLMLYCFDRKTDKLVPVGADFEVVATTDLLTEMAESYVLRGAFDDARIEAVKVREQRAIHPAQQPQLPVSLEVMYDGKVIPYEFRGGKALIPEPGAGQNVQLRLRRDDSKTRFGVVLKVNGENTLDKQRQSDRACRKWVLGPGEGPWVIGGYQIGSDKREPFRIASAPDDVGTITMTVFREQKEGGNVFVADPNPIMGMTVFYYRK